MNEKEAREIVDRWKDVLKETEDAQPLPSKIMKAHGYLEAIDKAKGLEEALHRMDGTKKTGMECCEIAKEALARWEKEK